MTFCPPGTGFPALLSRAPIDESKIRRQLFHCIRTGENAKKRTFSFFRTKIRKKEKAAGGHNKIMPAVGPIA